MSGGTAPDQSNARMLGRNPCQTGERVFFNFNCIVLDVCGVRIGDYTLFGPAVQIARVSAPSGRRSPAPDDDCAQQISST
jgi:acetyltransferase-like isoleucine patch superfamily enzyme